MEVFADSAYHSEESEQLLQAQGYRNRTHERAHRNRPLTKAQERANTRRSRHRARVEHVFAAPTQQGGKAVADDWQGPRSRQDRDDESGL